MPACYIPGVVIVVAIFGVMAILAELLKAVSGVFDSVVAGMEQALSMGAFAAKLTLAALVVTVAVEFVAASARLVRRYQARRLAATGQPCAQVDTCPVDCAVKANTALAEPAGRTLLPLTPAEHEGTRP